MDCRQGLIHQIDPDSTRADPLATIEVPAPAGCFGFNDDGRLIVALKDSIVLLGTTDGRIETVARHDDPHPDRRFNDGTVLPDGSFMVGTMQVPRPPDHLDRGGLYRLDDEGSLQCFDRGFGVVNGPRVSPLDGRLHVCDSASRVIWSYALDDVLPSRRRQFVDTDSLGSGPDGCCFDSDGGLWTALVRVGALVRFAPDGRLTRRIDLPVAHPTSLCFGGPALVDLFVTSIRDSGRLRADGPLDGAVLRISGIGNHGLATPVGRLRGRANPCEH